MAAPAVSNANALDRLLGMFVDPAAYSYAATDTTCPTLPQPTTKEAQQQGYPQPVTARATAAAPRLAFGYKVIPVNLVNGQQLAEPRVLAGTSALALHGLLMKLHAANMQPHATAEPSLVQSDTAQKSIALATSAEQQKQPLLNDTASTANLPINDTSGQQQPPGFDQLPAEVRKLVPDALICNGQTVLLQQLQQYLQMQQQSAGQQQHGQHRQQPGLHRQQQTTARVTATHQHKPSGDHIGLQDVQRASSSSCSDTSDLPAQQHDDDQQTAATDHGAAAQLPQMVQQAASHVEVGAVEAGADGADRQCADVMNRRLNWLTAEEMAAYLDQHLQRQHSVQAAIKQPASREPDLYDSHLQQQYEPRSSDSAPTGQPAHESSMIALAGSKRKRNGKGATQYRGVRLRPWGTYGAEIRHPQSGARVWLGSFTSAEDAALTYDAAVREIRGPKGVTNLPEPPEPERSMYVAKVRALLNSKTMHRMNQQQQDSEQLHWNQQQDDNAGPSIKQENIHKQMQANYWQQDFGAVVGDAYSDSPPAFPGLPASFAGRFTADEQYVHDSRAKGVLASKAGEGTDLGAYGHQTLQLAEELQQLQNSLRLGGTAAAGTGAGAANAVAGNSELLSPAGVMATEALLQLQSGT